MTQAIKRTNKLAYIGSRRFSNLSGGKFKSDAQPYDRIQLCEYDPKKWNFFVHLAWSKKGRSLNANALKDWRYRLLEFDTTNLHIFFRFLALPAMQSAFDFSHGTIDPKLTGGRVVTSEFGFDDFELATWFRTADSFLDEEVTSRAINLYDEPSTDAQNAFREFVAVGSSRHMKTRDVEVNAGGKQKLLILLDKMEKYPLWQNSYIY
ncbi:hypothetical protein [uncultured Tateyamaria sp.]|uniref:hypothetical protein n=1 Tax=uncultured Tateyamaria sp. TaxID=455651 RepID=UPI00262ABD1C|nr:hypothetical protein [uncultured Tateyamaria sp.]